MSIFPAPKDTKYRSDRDRECQEAIEAEFQSLADRAHEAGWSREQIATALMELAGDHFLAIDPNAAIYDLNAGFMIFGRKPH